MRETRPLAVTAARTVAAVVAGRRTESSNTQPNLVEDFDAACRDCARHRCRHELREAEDGQKAIVNRTTSTTRGAAQWPDKVPIIVARPAATVASPKVAATAAMVARRVVFVILDGLFEDDGCEYYSCKPRLFGIIRHGYAVLELHQPDDESCVFRGSAHAHRSTRDFLEPLASPECRG